jgi:helix-turn-helix protein
MFEGGKTQEGGLNCILEVKTFSQLKIILQRIKHKTIKEKREGKRDTEFILVPLTN